MHVPHVVCIKRPFSNITMNQICHKKHSNNQFCRPARSTSCSLWPMSKVWQRYEFIESSTKLVSQVIKIHILIMFICKFYVVNTIVNFRSYLTIYWKFGNECLLASLLICTWSFMCISTSASYSFTVKFMFIHHDASVGSEHQRLTTNRDVQTILLFREFMVSR